MPVAPIIVPDDKTLREAALGKFRALPRGAWRKDAVTETLSRTANLPSITAFTVMARVMRRGNGSGTWETAFSVNETSGGAYYSAYIQSMSLGPVFSITNWAAESGGSTIANNAWYHLTMTVAGTGAGQFLGYFNGALDVTLAGNTAVNTFGSLQVGSNTDAEWGNIRIADLRVWSAVLSAKEVQREVYSPVPVRWRNINGWYPMAHHSTARLDYSGRGNHFTAAGSPTTEPGFPWPLSWYQRRSRVFVAGGAPPADTTLAASASVGATASAAIATTIQMASTGSAIGAATAGLTTAIQMSSVGVGSGNATSQLSTTIQLATAATGVATGTAALVTAIPLESVGFGAATGQASLSTAIPLAGSGQSSGIGTAGLTTAISFAGSGQSVGIGTAGLTTNIPLSTMATVAGVGTSDLATAIMMAASGAGVATAVVSMSDPAAEFVVSANATAQATTTLNTNITMAASGSGVAIAVPNLTTQILLSVSANGNGVGSAELTTELQFSVTASVVGQGSANLQADTGFAVTASSIASAAAQLATDITFSASGSAIATATVSLVVIRPLPDYQLAAVYQPRLEMNAVYYSQFNLSAIYSPTIQLEAQDEE
jgi:hypothetical protein